METITAKEIDLSQNEQIQEDKSRKDRITQQLGKACDNYYFVKTNLQAVVI